MFRWSTSTWSHRTSWCATAKSREGPSLHCHTIFVCFTRVEQLTGKIKVSIKAQIMFHFVIITLHRDDFRVKLIDFGLAKELDANNRVRTGFAGTVGRTSFSHNSKVLWILDFPQYRGTVRVISISKQTKALFQVGFMAPEVANAQYKQDYASPASDLFSLGVAGHLIVMWIT